MDPGTVPNKTGAGPGEPILFLLPDVSGYDIKN
jgi:hypothetical protein